MPALVSKPSERNQFPVRPEEKQEEHGLICKDGCHCYYSREVNEKKKLIQNYDFDSWESDTILG